MTRSQPTPTRSRASPVRRRGRRKLWLNRWDGRAWRTAGRVRQLWYDVLGTGARDYMKSDPLSAYRAKRSPDRTPEPFGAAAEGPGGLFVLHKHAARRLHWDLRLEL